MTSDKTGLKVPNSKMWMIKFHMKLLVWKNNGAKVWRHSVGSDICRDIKPFHAVLLINMAFPRKRNGNSGRDTHLNWWSCEDQLWTLHYWQHEVIACYVAEWRILFAMIHWCLLSWKDGRHGMIPLFYASHCSLILKLMEVDFSGLKHKRVLTSNCSAQMEM